MSCSLTWGRVQAQRTWFSFSPTHVGASPHGCSGLDAPSPANWCDLAVSQASVLIQWWPRQVPGVECAGTLWHLRSNGEDALVCMMEDRIVEITTESMTMEVHSYVETPEGSPLDIPECEKHEEEEKPADEEVSMWAGNVSSTPWFVVPSEAIDGDVTAPVDPEDATPPPRYTQTMRAEPSLSA